MPRRGIRTVEPEDAGRIALVLVGAVSQSSAMRVMTDRTGMARFKPPRLRPGRVARVDAVRGAASFARVWRSGAGSGVNRVKT